MNERNVQQMFWVEFIHTIVGILNKPHFILNSDKTPYDLCNGRHTIVKHFRVFGSKCYINKNDEKLGEFDAGVDEGIFLGYSQNKKGYKCYNKNTKRIIEFIDVKVDEYIEKEEKQLVKPSTGEPFNIGEEYIETSTEEDDEETSSPQVKYPPRYIQKHHQTNQIFGDLNTSV